jgi:hypothetical protein
LTPPPDIRVYQYHKTIKDVSKTWPRQEVGGEISYKKLLWLYTDTRYAYSTISTSRTSFYTVSPSFHGPLKRETGGPV